MTDEEILRVWRTLANRTYTEARVYSCAISAYEDNTEQIDNRRAVAVMGVVWPENTRLMEVPRQCKGMSPDLNQNRLRVADFQRLLQIIRDESVRRPSGRPEQLGVDKNTTGSHPSVDRSTEEKGNGGESLVASDLEQPPTERVVVTVTRIVRDTELAKRIKGLHHQLCQLCGETVRLADGTGYAEGHQLQPLGKPHDGPDVAENIVCLCPNHHAACDLGAIRLAVVVL